MKPLSGILILKMRFILTLIISPQELPTALQGRVKGCFVKIILCDVSKYKYYNLSAFSFMFSAFHVSQPLLHLVLSGSLQKYIMRRNVFLCFNFFVIFRNTLYIMNINILHAKTQMLAKIGKFNY